MESRIFKFQLSKIYGPEDVAMPEGSNILAAAIQDGLISIWASCPVNAPKEERSLLLVFTGEHCPTVNHRHINTVFVNELVVHVFEKLP